MYCSIYDMLRLKHEKTIHYRLRRSRTHHGIRDISRKFRTRAYTKDLDQIHEDLKEGNIEKMKNQPIDADKTGLGQHYCVPCAYVLSIDFRISNYIFLTNFLIHPAVTFQTTTLSRSMKSQNFIREE